MHKDVKASIAMLLELRPRRLLCDGEGCGRQAESGPEPGHEHGEVQLRAGAGAATGAGQPGAGCTGDHEGGGGTLRQDGEGL